VCTRCKTEKREMRATCRKKHITIDKSAAAARDESEGSYFMVLCTSDTHTRDKRGQTRIRRHGSNSFLRSQEGVACHAFGQPNLQTRISPAPPSPACSET
jgi:hypothetical protein